MGYPDLQKQVAIVTGAGRGIGKAIAEALAEAGAHVFVAARTKSEIDIVCKSITAKNQLATPVVCDVSAEAEVIQLFNLAQDHAGQLDILINNAGVGLFGPLAEMSTADFDKVMNVNARGTYMCCREAMRLMTPRKSGTIINIASVTGFKGYANQSAYAASKHAILGMTKCLAIEAQRVGIRASAILPGGVDTEMIGDARPDLNRAELMMPQDIVDSVMYLLSLSPRASVDQIYIRRRTSPPF